MKFFFTGPGNDLIPQIDLRALKGYIEDKDIRAVRMVSDEVKNPDQFDDVNSTLTTLGDTMLKINQLDGGPRASKKEKKEADRKKGIRDDFKEAARKWYQDMGDWYRDGVLKQLEADKHKLIRYNEIIKTLFTTWSDIRAKDDQFAEVKLIQFNKEGDNSTITTEEEGLIEMIERVKIREEEVRETKRIKKELQKQNVKRGEAMMKKQDVVMYTGKPAFTWSNSRRLSAM